MSITELTHDRVDVSHQHRPARPCVIESAEQFQRVLQHERLRADRSQLPFCLITIDFGVDPSQLSADVPETIGRRLRVTDEVGWLIDGRLGVIAPYTSADGAQRLAQDLASLVGAQVGEPEFKIHEYCPAEAPRSARQATPSPVVDSTPIDHGDIENLLMRATPVWKRGIDIIVSAVALALLSPLFLLVAILIKLFAPGPVLFVQLRSGVAGKPFRMFKFRTMVVNAEAQRDHLMSLNEQDGPAFKITSDPRVTRLGHWLRRLSIDELPQLLNVLKGEMSLVGPRPLPCRESEGCQSWQRRRLTVAPGMTCVWQTTDRSSTVPFDQWMRMDVEYVDTRCLRTDLGILARTLLFVVGLRGR